MRHSIAVGTGIVALAVLAGAPRATAETVASKPVNTAAPQLSGVAGVGSKLTCSTGTWTGSPTSYGYEWLRDGTPIAGQTTSTYTLQSADQGHSISCVVIASNSGGYTITSLPTGTYSVSFSSFEAGIGYAPQYFSGKATANEATPVPVTAPNVTPSINAALQPASATSGGQISGRVTAAAGGAPVAGVAVCAEASGGGVSGGCATTTGGGEYTIAGLTSGTYSVSFSPDSEADNLLEQTQSGVVVSAPATTGSVNAALPAGGQITGKVTSSSTHGPLANIRVCVDGDCAQTNAAGEYTISGLETNTEDEVFFSVGESQQNYLSMTIAHVSVTAGSTTKNQNAELKPGGQITGTVTSAVGGAPVAGISVCASDTCGTTNASGQYTISTLETGEYIVEFRPGFEGGNYLPQFYEGKSSSTEATQVKVTAGHVTDLNKAELQPGGVISGRVTAAVGGGAVATLEVCAFSLSGDGYDACATTNANGEYTIGGLPSDTYNVSFEAGSSELGNFLPLTVASVSVTAPNATGPVNGVLQPGGEITGEVTSAATGAPLGGVEVCANETSGEKTAGGCGITGNGGTTSATSNALAFSAANSTFTVAKAPKFEAKGDVLVFFFTVANAGKFTWNLSFKNSDVAFASALNTALGAESPLAVSAKKHKSKKCKKGQIKHKGKCVSELVTFSSGSQSVASGTIEVKVHASAQAIKGLKAGHTLHVSGQFTFQSALGGASVSHNESATVKLPKKKAKKKHHKH